MVFSAKDPNSSLLRTLNLIVTILSLIGSGWMSIYCCRTRKKDVLTKLILTLAIADFLYSISNFLTTFEGDNDVDTMCMVEGFIRTTCLPLSAFTTCWIVIYCVIFLNDKNSSINQEKYFRGTLIASVSVSLVLGLG